MGSDNEYEQKQFWPEKQKLTTITFPDGDKISFCKEFWDELLYGDIIKLKTKNHDNIFR